MTPDILIQILLIALPAAQIVLVIAAMIHLRHQSLSERDLLLWDLIVLFVPLGAIMAFIYFSRHTDKRKR
jgi:hypothetical protein